MQREHCCIVGFKPHFCTVAPSLSSAAVVSLDLEKLQRTPSVAQNNMLKDVCQQPILIQFIVLFGSVLPICNVFPCNCKNVNAKIQPADFLRL